MGILFTHVTLNVDKWPPIVGAEGMKKFDFDNPRSLEKALSGFKKYYMGGFFWVPIPVKWYQNTSGFIFENIFQLMSLSIHSLFTIKTATEQYLTIHQ